MDRSLDEILAERPNKNGGSRGARGPRNPRGPRGAQDGNQRRERQDYPRDGIRKSYRERDESRNLDSEWVHDKFEDNESRRGRNRRETRRDTPEGEADSEGPQGTKIRVENIHYELSEEDLEELFGRIGRYLSLELKYDRSGRSSGTAFVVFENGQDAQRAVREFDGANAAGQPIRLSIVPSSRNPFDNAVKPSRPLAERITMPRRSRSDSPPERDPDEEAIAAARKGIDRYIPSGRGSRSRSPFTSASRRTGGGGGGRRPGARREQQRGGNQDGNDGGRSVGRDGRPKKTQEELDAEMDNYFGGSGGNTSNKSAGSGAAAGGDDDVDMIA